MLKDFNNAIRGGICGVTVDRYVKKGETWAKAHYNRNIWYIDANNLYGYVLMQKLPYKDLENSNVTLDEEETLLQFIIQRE